MLTVHDADRFSVAIPAGAHVCVVTTDARPDPAACNAALVEQTLPPDTAGVRTLAMGGVWITSVQPDVGAVISSPTSFSASLERVADPAAETTESATAYAKGMIEGFVQKLPGAVPGPPHVEMQDIAGLNVARITYEVRGLSADQRLLEHLVAYVVGAQEGIYSFALTSSAADAKAADAFAAEIAATLTVAHPAPARSASYRAGYAIGKVVGAVVPLLFVAVIAVAVLLAVRSRSKRPGG